MPRLIDEIPWSDPVLPIPADPVWEAEVVDKLGAPNKCYLYAARAL